MTTIKERLEVMFGVSGADKFKKEFEEADRAVQKSSKGITASLKGIATAAAAYLSLQAVRAIGSAAFELGKMADQFRVVQTSSQRLAKSIGQNSTEILNAVRRGVGGAVSDLEILKQVNQAILLGIPVTARQMESMAITATRLGRAVGRDAASALGDLVTGIGRMSPLILDNLGITIKAEEAFRDLGEGATDAEKRIAFFNAVMTKANEKSKELGDTGGTVGESWSKFTSKLSNFATRIGTDLVPALQKVVGIMTAIVEKTDSWYDSFVKLLDRARDEAGGASVGGRHANTTIARRKQAEELAKANAKAMGVEIRNRMAREKSGLQASVRAARLSGITSQIGDLGGVSPRTMGANVIYDPGVGFRKQTSGEMFDINTNTGGAYDGFVDGLSQSLETKRKDWNGVFKKVADEGGKELSEIPQRMDREFVEAFANISLGFSAAGVQSARGLFGNVANLGAGLNAFTSGTKDDPKWMTDSFLPALQMFGQAGQAFSGAVGIFQGIQMLNRKPDLTKFDDDQLQQRKLDLEANRDALGRGGNIGELNRLDAEIKAREQGKNAASSGSNAYSVTTSISETQANSILAVLETQRAQDAERNNLLGQSLAVQTDMKFLMSINSGNLLTFAG